MTARQLGTALLCLGAIALGATQYLGAPWPGVALCIASLLPWGLEAWFGWARTGDAEERVFEQRRIDALVALTNETHKMARDAHDRIETQGEQISSLRNALSLRGTLGG